VARVIRGAGRAAANRPAMLLGAEPVPGHHVVETRARLVNSIAVAGVTTSRAPLPVNLRGRTQAAADPVRRPTALARATAPWFIHTVTRPDYSNEA